MEGMLTEGLSFLLLVSAMFLLLSLSNILTPSDYLIYASNEEAELAQEEEGRYSSGYADGTGISQMQQGGQILTASDDDLVPYTIDALGVAILTPAAWRSTDCEPVFIPTSSYPYTCAVTFRSGDGLSIFKIEGALPFGDVQKQIESFEEWFDDESSEEVEAELLDSTETFLGNGAIQGRMATFTVNNPMSGQKMQEMFLIVGRPGTNIPWLQLTFSSDIGTYDQLVPQVSEMINSIQVSQLAQSSSNDNQFVGQGGNNGPPLPQQPSTSPPSQPPTDSQGGGGDVGFGGTPVNPDEGESANAPIKPKF